MALAPDHPSEQRARDLDAQIIRQARDASLHELRRLRAQHQRLYHHGEQWGESCWQCRLFERMVYKRLGEP